MNCSLLTLEQIAHARVHVVAWLRAQLSPHAQLQSDSRVVRVGDAFVSYTVSGIDSCSHVYITDAIQRGAAAVLVQPGGEFPKSRPVLQVPNLKQLAGYIASTWYGEPSRDMLMIGITGTNGKTTISHWVASALSGSGTYCAIVGTLGAGLPGRLLKTGFTTPDALQVPRSLVGLRANGARAVSMEVSSHALDQGRVNGVMFDIAVFTNLTQDHLDYHKNLESYEAAKVQLFNWPSLRAAVINRDDEVGCRLIRHLADRVPTISYGIASTKPYGDASLHAIAIRATATSTVFKVISDWGHAELEVRTFGTFNVANLLAVIGVLLAADVPFDATLSQIARLEPVNGRMQQLGGRPKINEPLVVIDYAHTPDALEKTLDTLRSIATRRGGQLICVFGCGGNREAAKRPLMGIIAERLSDSVIVTSDNPRSEPPLAIISEIISAMHEPEKAITIEDRGSAILQAVRGAYPADIVLIAGKGHEETQEVMGNKRPFLDQDYVCRALALRST
ncbi:UDP-N-acetylmuramoyl-L-alanyl-D-glutamate--2,6-diaminopimelate ligase [Candidatus Vallotia cooleyia]|uniref:UDP-N-acetylmuramoyl-L-alanyl-D-glutamate--2, 6-diaminopimelate ligase n=1 Tax=Candidatus Vallotiella adelgis TaxID=1177211 RepID=UPI001D00C301|nr:UDP-N-acetylmuramoyl-L-alanyl-D-glutamate--2,6-diaminopimelate ligase [Candidatus Vallotia cooleyia]UDG82229.1 UDP-N-acetylmuramoyl-L-alanyl-D-glutamate--2,6-diaminopimelate ligase [Candidatus Vallotia cooleyia]